MKVSLIQLGCPKNVVDGEWVLGRLLNKGNTLSDYENADVVLINTCGFIDSAKEESLQAILNCIEDKKKGKLKKIIVFGCLSERYQKELEEEFPEVDGFFPLSVLPKAERMLSESHHKFKKGGLVVPDFYKERFRITPSHYSYVKIGDGCDHKCSFCAIPFIRGKGVSRRREGIIKELKILAEEGIKEAILISQDTTSYGRDNGDSISNLLREIESSKTPKWIRLLYLYPTSITKEFISIVSQSSKIVRYFDIPLQHASKSVLRAMKRGGDYSFYIKLIERIRKELPDACIRSSFIVGFPNENKNDFEELKRFLQEASLDHAGFFIYSNEEGTEAFKLKDGVSQKEKEERLAELASIQEKIAKKKNAQRIGKKFEVLVEGFYEETDLLLKGRTYFQAPDIDGITLINKGECQKGDFSKVKITKTIGYDILGEVVNE